MGNENQEERNNKKLKNNCFEIQDNFKIPENPDEIAALAVQKELSPKLQKALASKTAWANGSNLPGIIKMIYGANKVIKHTETGGKKEIPFSLHENLPKSLTAAILYSHSYYEYYFDVKFTFTSKLENASIFYQVSKAKSEKTDAWVESKKRQKDDYHTCIMHFAKDTGTHNVCKELDEKYKNTFSNINPKDKHNVFLSTIYQQSWPQILNNNKFTPIFDDFLSKSVIATLTHEDEHAFLGAGHTGNYQACQLSSDTNTFYKEVVDATPYRSSTSQIAPSYLGWRLPMWSTSLLGDLMFSVDTRYGRNKRSFKQATYTLKYPTNQNGIYYNADNKNNLTTWFYSKHPTPVSYTLYVEGKRNILNFNPISFSPSTDSKKQTGMSIALKPFGSAMALQDGNPIAYFGLPNGERVHEVRINNVSKTTPSHRIAISKNTVKVVITGSQKDTVIYFPEQFNPNTVFTLETYNSNGGIALKDNCPKYLNIKAKDNVSSKDVSITYCDKSFHITLPHSNSTSFEETQITTPNSLEMLNVNDVNIDLSSYKPQGKKFTLTSGDIIKVNYLFDVPSSVHYNASKPICSGHNIKAKRTWDVRVNIAPEDKGKVFVTRITHDSNPRYNDGDLIVNKKNTVKGNTLTSASFKCDERFLSYYRLVTTSTLSKPVTVTATSSIKHTNKVITKDYTLSIKPGTEPYVPHLVPFTKISNYISKTEHRKVSNEEIVGVLTRENTKLPFYTRQGKKFTPKAAYTCNTRYYKELGDFKKLYVDLKALDHPINSRRQDQLSFRFPDTYIAYLSQNEAQKLTSCFAKVNKQKKSFQQTANNQLFDKK